MPRRPSRSLAHLFAAVTVALTACAPARQETPAAGEDVASVKRAIEAQIARSVQATRDKDIDALLSVQTEDFVLENDTAGDEHGERVNQEQLRANLLRDWGIIVENRAIDIVVDSLAVHGDSAVVFTSQRYERMMLERDGVTRDHVVTTVTHREPGAGRPQDGGWPASVSCGTGRSW